MPIEPLNADDYRALTILEARITELKRPLAEVLRHAYYCGQIKEHWIWKPIGGAIELSPEAYQAYVNSKTSLKSLNLHKRIWTILASGWRSLRVTLARFWR